MAESIVKRKIRLHAAAFLAVFSVLGVFVVSVANLHASSNITAYLTTSISNGVTFIPIGPGNYDITSEVVVSKSGVNIVGAGREPTFLIFKGAGGNCFRFQNANSSVNWYGSLEHLTILATDTTHTKVAIKAVDVSGLHVDDVNIRNWWGGDSVGLYVLGREDSTFSRLIISATVPVRIGPNPDTTPVGVLSADHMVFRDLYLISSDAPATLPWASVLVDPGTHISNTEFEGRQAWVTSKYGFYWAQGSVLFGVSYNLAFHNVRTEQTTDATGYSFYIDTTGGGTLQGCTWDNCSFDIQRNGLYLRTMYCATLRNCLYAGPMMMDADYIYGGLKYDNLIVNGTPTQRVSNLTLQWSVPGNYTVPYNAIYRK